MTLPNDPPTDMRERTVLLTYNMHDVRKYDELIYIMGQKVNFGLTKEEAMNLAAWLVTRADPEKKYFHSFLADVYNA